MRALAPASLRYLELEPGPGPAAPWLLGAQLGGLAALLAGAELGATAALWAGPAAAVGFWGLAAWKARRRDAGMRTVPTRMRFTPWGIVLDPEGEPEPLSWLELVDYEHEQVEGRRRGSLGAESPSTSVVRVVHGQTRHVAARSFELDLEGLEGILPALRAERRRPIALGLEASAPHLEVRAPGAFTALVVAARGYLASGAGESALTVRRGGYRAQRLELSDEGKALLRAAVEEPPGASDTAPFAAVLAAELGHAELVPALAQIALAAHPFVAATMKAAANRLGGARALTGPVDEVRPFLDEAEIGAMEAWSGEVR